METRTKARDLVRAGRVLVNGKVASKPSMLVGAEADLQVEGPPPYVGRAAEKLSGALASLGVEPAGKVWVDVGAGTGGFTQVLLEKGARRVYALDVGHGQLHPSLREDSRVVVMEGVNARGLKSLPESVDAAVTDVSFISSTLILPGVYRWLEEGGEALVLVKPQFELEPGLHSGVVRDASLQRRAVEKVRDKARSLGFAVLGEVESPLPGRSGNREFWLYLRKPGADVA